ncbi:transcription factor [Elasticomyces elasticus]|nr:transcription factor [Elasticomyces elasticus]KAK3649528.1 transcription factor [Elasticomyces elasticus]KAK4933050.1 transcription factor [Elasticomyces elasticus]KAK5763949.1 transcription factor [Elasticomyces elasticus]
MWECSVPAIAFDHPVAAHAVLALSAFSLRSSTESTLYDLQATAELHYCRGLQILRASLPVLDQSNADAVLACAMVLIPTALAFARQSAQRTPQLDWLYHLRAWPALGASIYDTTQSTTEAADRLIPYPQRGIPDGEQHASNFDGDALCASSSLLYNVIRHSWQGALEGLGAAIERSAIVHSETDCEAFSAALAALQYVMKYTLECRVVNLFRTIFTWPIKISKRFILMVIARDHIALAIYTHWLVLTILLKGLWFVGDFGSDRIQRLEAWYKRWDSPYIGLLRWPVETRIAWECTQVERLQLV